MPLHEYACRCGTLFELLEPLDAPSDPICPACGCRRALRQPSCIATAGRAGTGPPRHAWPRTWAQVGHGDRATIAAWQRTVERRLTLEARHPELAPPPPVPVASHERDHAHPHLDPMSEARSSRRRSSEP